MPNEAVSFIWRGQQKRDISTSLPQGHEEVKAYIHMVEGPLREQAVLLLDSLRGETTEEFSCRLLNQQRKHKFNPVFREDVHAAAWWDRRAPRKQQELLGL